MLVISSPKRLAKFVPSSTKTQTEIGTRILMNLAFQKSTWRSLTAISPITITKTTDANGKICTVVPLGMTKIEIDDATLPPGLVLTAGSDYTMHNVQGNFIIDRNGYELKKDDGNQSRRQLATQVKFICAHVFEDTNAKNGFHNPLLGEPDIPNVDVVFDSNAPLNWFHVPSEIPIYQYTLVSSETGLACTEVPPAAAYVIVTIDKSGVTIPPSHSLGPTFANPVQHNVQCSPTTIVDEKGYE